MTNPQLTQWGKTQSSFLKIRNKAKMSTFPTLIQHNTEVLATAIRKEEIKGIQTGKEEVKM